MSEQEKINLAKAREYAEEAFRLIFQQARPHESVAAIVILPNNVILAKGYKGPMGVYILDVARIKAEMSLKESVAYNGVCLSGLGAVSVHGFGDGNPTKAASILNFILTKISGIGRPSPGTRPGHKCHEKSADPGQRSPQISEAEAQKRARDILARRKKNSF